MANPDIGHIKCPICKRTVPVRETQKRKKLYAYCGKTDDYAGCGTVSPNMAGAQQWFKENMTVGAPTPENAPEETEAAPAKPVESQSQEPKPKSKAKAKPKPEKSETTERSGLFRKWGR